MQAIAIRRCAESPPRLLPPAREHAIERPGDAVELVYEGVRAGHGGVPDTVAQEAAELALTVVAPAAHATG